jgi:hypothetical protein
MYVCIFVVSLCLIAVRVYVGTNTQFGVGTLKGNQGISACMFHYYRICCSCVVYVVSVLYGNGYSEYCLRVCLLFIYYF